MLKHYIGRLATGLLKVHVLAVQKMPYTMRTLLRMAEPTQGPSQSCTASCLCLILSLSLIRTFPDASPEARRMEING